MINAWPEKIRRASGFENVASLGSSCLSWSSDHFGCVRRCQQQCFWFMATNILLKTAKNETGRRVQPRTVPATKASGRRPVQTYSVTKGTETNQKATQKQHCFCYYCRQTADLPSSRARSYSTHKMVRLAKEITNLLIGLFQGGSFALRLKGYTGRMFLLCYAGRSQRQRIKCIPCLW